MAVRFSHLASTFPAQTNPLYREREQRLAQGLPVVDLVSGNVTEHGIAFPPDLLRDILGDAARRVGAYRPDPLGQHPAREAIRTYYRDRGIEIPASQVVLTPGSSLAYWYALSIFCDPGDDILVPRPSYPLFDDLAALARVRLTSYRLDETREWTIDVNSLTSAMTDKTRAIVLVSPHNPTGAVASREEIESVAAVAADRDLPIIADEVFGDFLFGFDRLPRPAATPAPLVVTLNGFSKLLALPGIKLGWMALTGPAPNVTGALAALERISDSLLPVNEIVQAAVPRLLSDGAEFVSRYRKEMTNRRDHALEIITRSDRIAVIAPRGGFYAAVRVDTRLDDEALALHILRQSGCLIHPGFFYDLDPTHIVLSVVSAPKTAREALGRLVSAIETAP